MKRRKGTQAPSLFALILALMILACQGAGGLNPFATATLTPTATFTPTLTFTVTSSPTSTATLSPTATPRPTGIVIKEQANGGTLVIDYNNHCQFLLPPKWDIILSSQTDLLNAIDFASTNNPDFASLVESFKNADPDVFRLAAVNTDQNSVSRKFPGVLTVNAFSGSTWGSMPMGFVTAMIEDNMLDGATSASWDVVDNINKIEIGIVQGTRTITTLNGTRVTAAEMVIAFQANEKLIAIDIAVSKEFEEAILTPFDDIIDSIKTGI